ncbi:hypothetical protein VTN49DRAFT_4393 [Thermomyces lanuginosus]|uniref:uncharacterized protein n=1 Tax=Thermomyces lanuginosus TaxID=5541 RepID=UPI003742811D
MGPNIYSGEILQQFGEFETLYRFLPAANSGSSDGRQRPLVIFIPGAAHLARISYGVHPGHIPQDFIAHWLNQAGYDVLAVSYPLEMLEPEAEVISPRYPAFNLTDWGNLTAQTARAVINKYRASSDGCEVTEAVNQIVVLAWSMAGRILKPLVHASRANGLDLRLFISLAATPGGITGVRPADPIVHRSSNGYAVCPIFQTSFLAQLREMQQLDRPGRSPIIDEESYRRDYVGHLPVQLNSWDLAYCESDDPHAEHSEKVSGFVRAPGQDLRYAAPERDYELYPYIAAIRPTVARDLRHTLIDAATWGTVLTLKLTADVSKTVPASTPDNEDWRTLLALLDRARKELTEEVVQGNHFFFVGERGAKETAAKITALIERSEKLRADISKCLDRLKK